jgi:actin-related protein
MDTDDGDLQGIFAVTSSEEKLQRDREQFEADKAKALAEYAAFQAEKAQKRQQLEDGAAKLQMVMADNNKRAAELSAAEQKLESKRAAVAAVPEEVKRPPVSPADARTYASLAGQLRDVHRYFSTTNLTVAAIGKLEDPAYSAPIKPTAEGLEKINLVIGKKLSLMHDEWATVCAKLAHILNLIDTIAKASYTVPLYEMRWADYQKVLAEKVVDKTTAQRKRADTILKSAQLLKATTA